jgi:hypothetical protein
MIKYIQFSSIAVLMAVFSLVFVSCGQQEKEQKKEKKSKQDENLPSFFSMMGNQEVFPFELRADYSALFADLEKPEYQSGKFSWIDETGELQSLTVGVRARGVSRKRFCDFPPIKLNFLKKELKALGLKRLDEYKLVTHCIEGNSPVLREYLAYQFYSLLTEKSFRTRLVQVEYIDIGTEKVIANQYGIIVENEKELARRLGGKIYSPPSGELGMIDAKQYQMLTVFQYMVGNTDWNLALSHNIRLLQTEEGKAPIPIPYDFDLCGMVNAPYAIPAPNLPISTVRERFFQWRSKNLTGLDETLVYFNEKRPEFYQIVNDFTLLDEASKKDVLAYLESFYEIINDPERMEKEMLVNRKG